MPSVSILIKPASSGCNLACRYCFYHAIAENRKVCNYGIMTEDTLEQLVKAVLDYADGFAAFAFQGGEPTLAGLDFYRKTITLQKKYNTKKLVIQNTIQTNGTLMNEAWAQFLAEQHFLVGLSLDGPRGVNDFCRVTKQGKSTFDAVLHAVRLFEQYGVEYNICSVVTAKTAEKIPSIYNFFKQKGFQYLQFIPCLDETIGDHSEFSLTPRMYGTFLCKLFDLWYSDFIKGKQIDIRMFSNYAQMAAGFAPEECGMCGHCNTYFAVESDGSVYPCDFYTQDEWRLGTIWDGFQVLYDSKTSQAFMKASLIKPEECRICQYAALCRVGCRRWRDRGDGNLTKNYLCESYQMFFRHCGDRIQKLGDYILRRYNGMHP